MDVLAEGHVRAWREQGFAVVDGVFPEALLARAMADLSAKKLLLIPSADGMAIKCVVPSLSVIAALLAVVK